MNQAQNNEIDLFEVFNTLWEGKWKIIATTFFAALVAVAFNLVTPNSFKVSTTIDSGKQSVFLPYTSLNNLLRNAKMSLDSYTVDSETIFEMFVIEFNEYREMVNVLSDNKLVKQSIKDLNEADKQSALIDFAKLFKIIPPSKDGGLWLLSFEWYDPIEGAQLLNNAIQQTLITVQKTAKKNFEELAIVVDTQNSREVEKLRNEISLLPAWVRDRTAKQLNYLIEQSAIAQELGISTNRLDANALAQSSQNGISLSVNSHDIPYYLRGYKAIDKEISIIRNRTDEELLLNSDGYLKLKEKLGVAENSLLSFHLRASLKMIEADNPNDWIQFNLALAEKKSQKKLLLYVTLSIVLGGMIGATYVLILNAISKR